MRKIKKEKERTETFIAGEFVVWKPKTKLPPSWSGSLLEWQKKQDGEGPFLVLTVERKSKNNGDETRHPQFIKVKPEKGKNFVLSGGWFTAEPIVSEFAQGQTRMIKRNWFF